MVATRACRIKAQARQPLCTSPSISPRLQTDWIRKSAHRWQQGEAVAELRQEQDNVDDGDCPEHHQRRSGARLACIALHDTILWLRNTRAPSKSKLWILFHGLPAPGRPDALDCTRTR